MYKISETDFLSVSLEPSYSLGQSNNSVCEAAIMLMNCSQAQEHSTGKKTLWPLDSAAEIQLNQLSAKNSCAQSILFFLKPEEQASARRLSMRLFLC